VPRKQAARIHDSSKKKQAVYTIGRHYRYWEVRDPVGELVCLTVYKRGAKEVIRRLCA
jgi:hypothetical protein